MCPLKLLYDNEMELIYQQVNEVRSRPGVNMPALESGLSQDQMRDKLRHERRVEFAMEGLRLT